MWSYSRLLSVAMIFAPVGLCFGGAWTQDQGKAQIIVTSSFYTASSYRDTHGKGHTEPTYRAYGLNPYIEYGVRDDITIGANVALEALHQNVTGGGGNASWGLGDSEFFIRKRIWQDNGFVVSLEPMIKLPSPEASSTQPIIGSRYVDTGLGLSAGYGFDAYGQHHYIDVDTQYRKRFGAPSDQIRISATAGIGLTPRWTLMPQTFLTYRTSSPSHAAFTQSSTDDYNVMRVQLSALYALSDTLNLQVGGFSDINGKNAGQGNGVLLALWMHL